MITRSGLIKASEDVAVICTEEAKDLLPRPEFGEKAPTEQAPRKTRAAEIFMM